MANGNTKQHLLDSAATKSGAKARAGRIALTLLTFIIITLLFSIVTGFLAVVLTFFLNSPLSLATIQGILVAFVTLGTLCLAPLAFHSFFMALKSYADTRSWVKSTRKSLKHNYARIIIILIGSLCAGWIVVGVVSLLPKHLVLSIIEYALLFGIGTCAIYLMYRGYNTRSYTPRHRGSPHPFSKGPKRDAGSVVSFFSYQHTSYTPSQKRFPLIQQTSLTHKSVRLFLALLLIFGTLPSIMLLSMT